MSQITNEMEYQLKIESILKWAEKRNKSSFAIKNNKFFDTTFVKDIQQKILDFDRVTEGQMESIDNIISKWYIKI